MKRQIAALANEIEAEVADSINRVQSVAVAQAKAPLSQSELERLREEASHVPKEELPISSFKKEDDTTTTKTKVPVSYTFDIQKTKVLSTPKVDYDYILQRPPETKWCKRGYYVEYNNTLRIGISNLNRNEIVINLKRIKGEDEAEPIIKNPIEMRTGTFINIYDGDYRYKISLDYIGSAGRNPFTQAAYITVASYKK